MFPGIPMVRIMMRRVAIVWSVVGFQRRRYVGVEKVCQNVPVAGVVEVANSVLSVVLFISRSLWH